MYTISMEQQTTITAQKVGRPTVITPDVTRRLIAAFERGFTDETACSAAGISTTAYYKHLKENEAFRIRIQQAKVFLLMLAGQHIADVLYDSVREQNGEKRKYSTSIEAKTAMWVLERKEPEAWGRFVCKQPCCEDRRWREREMREGRNPDSINEILQRLDSPNANP
jgi:hypothetical protein